MRAREWTIATRFHEPSDYGVPELPNWRTIRDECGGLVIAGEETERFIAAQAPMKVRR